VGLFNLSGLSDSLTKAMTTAKDFVDDLPKEEFKDPTPVDPVQPVEGASQLGGTTQGSSNLSTGGGAPIGGPRGPIAPVEPTRVDDGIKNIGLSGAELLSTEAPGGDKDTVAAQHFSDILKGQDSATNKLLNQFSEGSAARDAAARGAAGQKAQQAGMSESLQALTARETTRDIEQARQEGIADVAIDLAKRQDVAARDLYAVGQDEKNEAWRAYQDVLANGDLKDPEVAQQALDLQFAATGNRGNIDSLISDQWTAEKSEALGDIYDYLTIYGDDLPTNTDGTANIYDGSGNISDPILAKHLEDGWNAQNEGNPDMPFDLEDPYVTDWIDAQVDLGTEKENDFLVQEGRKDIDKVVDGMVARGEITEEQAEVTKQAMYASLETEIYYGGDNPVKKDDFGFGTITVDGVEVADMNTFTDENETTWTLDRDTSSLTEVALDGTTTQYKYKDGDWYSVREYSDAYKKIAGTDFKETKLTDDEVASKGFGGINIGGAGEGAIDEFGQPVVSAPEGTKLNETWYDGDDLYIKTSDGPRLFDEDIDLNENTYQTWSGKATLTEEEQRYLGAYLQDTEIYDIPASIMNNLIDNNNTEMLTHVADGNQDIKKSGQGGMTSNRTKILNLDGNKPQVGDYMNVGGHALQVKTPVVSYNYQSKQRLASGGERNNWRDHHGERMIVTDLVTGEEFTLIAVNNVDEGKMEHTNFDPPAIYV